MSQEFVSTSPPELALPDSISRSSSGDGPHSSDVLVEHLKRSTSSLRSQPSTRRASLANPSTRPGSCRNLFRKKSSPTSRQAALARLELLYSENPLPTSEDGDPSHSVEWFDVPTKSKAKVEEEESTTDTPPDDDWSGRYADLWNAKAWFPKFMGTDVPSFARFLFWHSLLLTSITPLVRAVTGVWKAEVPSIWILNALHKIFVAISVSTGGRGSPFSSGPPSNTTSSFSNTDLIDGGSVDYRLNNVSMTAKSAPEMDTTWMIHAVTALTWLVVSYLQIAIIPKYGSKSMHRRTGPVALIVLFIHLASSFHILIMDQQKNHTLNKAALSAMAFYVGAYAVVGTHKAYHYLRQCEKRKAGSNNTSRSSALLLKEHVNQMMIGWIWSLSGAGAIRTVGAIIEPWGIGPVACQNQYGSVNPVQCMWPYFNRLLWIASWDLLMIGVYCRIMQQRELTRSWIHNINYHWKLCAFFFVLEKIPGSAQFISTLLGGAANPVSSIITYALWVLQAMQFAAFFPSTTK